MSLDQKSRRDARKAGRELSRESAEESRFFNKRDKEVSRRLASNLGLALWVGAMSAGMLAYLVAGDWRASIFGGLLALFGSLLIFGAVRTAKRTDNALATRAYILALVEMFCAGNFAILFANAALIRKSTWLVIFSGLAVVLFLYLTYRNHDVVIRELVVRDSQEE